MSIASNNIITWSDITTSLLSTIKNVCCNIDSFASNIPSNLRSGTASNPTIWTCNTTQGSTNYGADYGNQWVSQTFTFKANNSTNLISTVATATVANEWTAFLSAAKIDARSNKLIQAKDFGRAMGLVSQFMAAHLKPVYSRRDVFDNGHITNNGGTLSNTGTQSVFQGTKYVTGTVTPKYTQEGVSPTSTETVTNSDITTLVEQNIIIKRDSSTVGNNNYGTLDRNKDPRPHRVYIN